MESILKKESLDLMPKGKPSNWTDFDKKAPICSLSQHELTKSKQLLESISPPLLQPGKL